MPVIGCLVLALGISADTLIGAVASSMSPQYAADLSGVVATNAQLSGALGVALAGSTYAALATDPGRALGVVLAGFVVLTLVGAAAAQRLVR